jgi:hypothetical protein
MGKKIGPSEARSAKRPGFDKNPGLGIAIAWARTVIATRSTHKGRRQP